MVIGSSPKDKDTGNITVMNRIGTRAIGKMIGKKGREFNTKEGTNMKDNLKTVSNIVPLPLWSL